MTELNIFSRTQEIIVNPSTSAVTIVNAGPPGPVGAAGSNFPSPSEVVDNQMLVTQSGELVYTPLPEGTGDMHKLIYDPNGVEANAFDASNLTGVLDAGVFT